MEQGFTADQFCAFITRYSERLETCTALLNDLDNRIGDGDHGTNMVRGFAAAAEKLRTADRSDLGGLCHTVAMALLGSVGGASGPLYGTAFMKFGVAWRGFRQVSEEQFCVGLKSATDGIAARGKALPGDKTMLDVWTQVVAHIPAAQDTEGQEWCCEAVRAAQDAAVSSRDLIARKGRAAYLGERSQGTCDPGSVSSAMLLEELFDAAVGGVERSSWATAAL